MAVTPQTNTTLEEIAQVLLKAHTVAICGHVSPDGDCLGSGLGLACALRQLGKTVFTLTAGPESIDASLRFLPGTFQLMSASLLSDVPDPFPSGWGRGTRCAAVQGQR